MIGPFSSLTDAVLRRGISICARNPRARALRPLVRAFARSRLTEGATRRAGPLYTQNHSWVQMDITYDCNLKCRWCGRACAQAPSLDRISPEQVRLFISESIAQNRKWALLRIMGGEPTTHPELDEILDILMEYKRGFSPSTILRLETNGWGDKVDGILSRLPPEITVLNTGKESPHQMEFCPVNIAPLDLPQFSNMDFGNACKNKQVCGIGFTPYGYYVCGTAGAIDRVFGFDIGKKELPRVGDNMLEQTKALCGYCGFFMRMAGIPETDGHVSKSWREALDRYEEERPVLSLYGERKAEPASAADVAAGDLANVAD